MVRPLRISFENAFYHLTARGNRRDKIFYANRDREVFLNRLKEKKCHRDSSFDNNKYKTEVKINRGQLELKLSLLFFRNRVI